MNEININDIKFNNLVNFQQNTFNKIIKNRKLVENVKTNYSKQIKHFMLPDGAHLYAITSEITSMLISPIELPNITYTNDNWKKTLLPNSDFASTTGAYIHAKLQKGNLINLAYTLYDNGSILCNCGYNYDENNSANNHVFFKLGKENTSNEYITQEDTTSLLDVISIESNSSDTFDGPDTVKLENMIDQLSHIENGTLDQFTPQPLDLLNSQENFEKFSKIFHHREPNFTEPIVEIPDKPEMSVMDFPESFGFLTPDLSKSQNRFLKNVSLVPTNKPSILNRIKDWFKNKLSKKDIVTVQDSTPSLDSNTFRDNYIVKNTKSVNLQKEEPKITKDDELSL